MSDVPTTSDGRPMSKVHFHVAEKIGLPNYSNVEIGSSITRYVDPDKELDEIRDISKIVENEVLAIERQKVLDAVKKQTL